MPKDIKNSTETDGARPQKVKSSAKQDKLAEALRANLRRRKEQARERKKT